MSCWMDTTWVVSFWAYSNACDAIENILVCEGASDLPLDRVFHGMKDCRVKLLGDSSNHEVALELAKIKRQLRPFVVAPHHGSPSTWTQSRELDAFDNEIGWLSCALEFIPKSIHQQPLSPAQLALQRHFRIWYVRYRFCTRGDPFPIDNSTHPSGHYSIQSISADSPAVHLWARHHKNSKGNFEEYLQRRMTILDAGSPISCWRSTEGKVLCPGDAVDSAPIVSLPHILLLRTDTGETTTAGSKYTKWNFQLTVHPFGKVNQAAIKAGAV
ncbi:hypothetical protein V5O48_019315, partial [Marasmius crinis-equi]